MAARASTTDAGVAVVAAVAHVALARTHARVRVRLRTRMNMYALHVHVHTVATCVCSLHTGRNRQSRRAARFKLNRVISIGNRLSIGARVCLPHCLRACAGAVVANFRIIRKTPACIMRLVGSFSLLGRCSDGMTHSEFTRYAVRGRADLWRQSHAKVDNSNTEHQTWCRRRRIPPRKKCASHAPNYAARARHAIRPPPPRSRCAALYYLWRHAAGWRAAWHARARGN